LGFGVGAWAPNPKPPIPNPHFPLPKTIKILKILLN